MTLHSIVEMIFIVELVSLVSQRLTTCPGSMAVVDFIAEKLGPIRNIMLIELSNQRTH